MGCTLSKFDCVVCLKREEHVVDSAIRYSDLETPEDTEASLTQEAELLDADEEAADVHTETPVALPTRRERAARGRRVEFAQDLESMFIVPRWLRRPFGLIQVVAEMPDPDAASVNYFSLLPPALIIRIFSLLDDASLLSASMASRHLADVCRQEWVVRWRIEQQIGRAMVSVEEDSDECNELWSHVIYMWEARCPFIFNFKRELNDLNKVPNDTVDNLALATLPEKMNI